MRVATLLPSATEIVCALGLGDSLVGVSHSCKFPAEVAALPRMTSTRVPIQSDSQTIDNFVREHLDNNDALYDLDLDALRAAAPDVIVSQTLCDVCAVSTGDVFAALNGLPSQPTLIDLTPNTLDDVLADCERVGEALGAWSAARALLGDLQARLDAVAARTATIADEERLKIGFLEWLLPPFNGGHWNPEIVKRAGGIDVLGAHGQPSSTLTWEKVQEADPDILFVACCGLSSERALRDIRELATNPAWGDLGAVRQGRVLYGNGHDYFSCPGPRLVDSIEILAHALYPNVHPGLHPGSEARHFAGS